MNVLALCAGVGGLELGLKLARPDARTVCYVEGEAYAASILVRRMAEEALDEAPVWSDVRTFDGKPWRGVVDCVTGGYPCQPFSTAGKRRGEDDPRHLWPHIKRILTEIGPRRCFFENVGGHLSMGFEAVGDDLQGMGYKAAAGLFTAEEVGASHKRERLFILAELDDAGFEPVQPNEDERQGVRGRHASCDAGGDMADSRHVQSQVKEGDDRQYGERAKVRRGKQQPAGIGTSSRVEVGDSSEGDGGHSTPAQDEKSYCRDVGDSHLSGPQGRDQPLPERTYELSAWPPSPADRDRWERTIEARPDLEPAVCRVADGLAYRVDRLRACGNGVVPLVAAYAYRTLSLAL